MPSSNGAAVPKQLTFLPRESPGFRVDSWVAGDWTRLYLGPLTRCHDTAELPVVRPPAAQNCHVMSAHAQDGEFPTRNS